MYVNRLCPQRYRSALLALVLFASAGINACEFSDSETKKKPTRSFSSAEGESSAEPSIVVCHPEITKVFVRLGVTSVLLGADSDSLRIDGVPQVIDAGPGCGLSTRFETTPIPATILKLRNAQSESSLPLSAGADSGPRQITLDAGSLDEIVAAIRRVGNIAEHAERTQIEIARITHTIGSIAVRRDGLARLNVAWILDREPLTVVGATGLLHELLELAGGENAFHDRIGSRFEVTVEEIQDRSPDLVLVSTAREEFAEKLKLPVRRIPRELSRVPTLEPVVRLTALHEVLYPEGGEE